MGAITGATRTLFAGAAVAALAVTGVSLASGPAAGQTGTGVVAVDSPPVELCQDKGGANGWQDDRNSVGDRPSEECSEQTSGAARPGN